MNGGNVLFVAVGSVRKNQNRKPTILHDPQQDAKRPPGPKPIHIYGFNLGHPGASGGLFGVAIRTACEDLDGFPKCPETGTLFQTSKCGH